jgi:hypothetical protein
MPITLHLHDDTYIALSGAYEHKEAIKALGAYPDVQWHPSTGRWLLHAGLLDKLLDQMARYIMPPSVDFWLGYPLDPPVVARKPRKPTQRELMAKRALEKKAARHWGKQFVNAIREKEGI